MVRQGGTLLLNDFRKCLELIDSRTATRGALIGGLMLVAALLEAFGLGLIYAFIRELLNPGSAETIPLIGAYLSDFSAGKDATRVIIIVSILLAIFLIKNIFLIVFYYIQAGFIASNEAALAIRLLNYYLHGSYGLHITRNSADLIRNITGSTSTVFSAVTMGFITLASELVVVIAVGILLICLEPTFTIGSILILGTAIGVFFVFSRSHVTRWGRNEQQSQGAILKALQQGFHSIKEVKILGCENAIRQSFIGPRMQLAQTKIKFATMSNAPRIWTETVVVTTILSSVLFILSTSGHVSEILSALALFGAATFRMMPSMNRILLAMNAIKGGTHSIALVYDDTIAFRKHPDIAINSDGALLTFENELVVDGVSFSYMAGETPVLRNVSFSIRPGESIGFVGPSGAGKTTLIDVLAGLLAPTSGSITADGRNIYEVAGQWRRLLGYVPQAVYLTDDTLRRNIAFGQNDDQIDVDKLSSAIRLAQLDEIVACLPLGLETTLGDRGVRLSGGQRQRVGIARALYNDPAVLIFDEATSALDNETEHEVNNAIQTLKGKKTLLVIAHRLSTVRQCDRLIYLKNGRVEDAGSFVELVEKNPEFRKLVELAQL